MGITAELPKTSACHIQCISCSSASCPSWTLDTFPSCICLQLIYVLPPTLAALLGDAHERTSQTQLSARLPCPWRVAYSKSPTCHLISNQMVSDSGSQPPHLHLSMQGDAENRSADTATEHCPGSPSALATGASKPSPFPSLPFSL